MMGRGYDLSKSSDVRRWARDVGKTLQKGIDQETRRHPVRIPIQTEGHSRSSRSPFSTGPTMNTTNYHGPVTVGDGNHVQVASGNTGPVEQHLDDTEIPADYAALVQAVNQLISYLPALGLDEDSIHQIEKESEVVFAEVVRDTPDRGLLSRTVTMLKGLLASVSAGVGAAATDESRELASGLIRQFEAALG